MNINKLLGSILVAVLMAGSSVAFAETKSIVKRISELKSSIIEAHADAKISKTERQSLLDDWKKLNKLYTSYLKDKKLSRAEEKALDSKIKKFDLNLFRKKYD